MYFFTKIKKNAKSRNCLKVVFKLINKMFYQKVVHFLCHVGARYVLMINCCLIASEQYF